MFRYILLLAKLKGGGSPFLNDARKGMLYKITPKTTLHDKNLSFYEILNNSPLLCYLLDPPYLIITAGHGVLNYVDRFQDL